MAAIELKGNQLKLTAVVCCIKLTQALLSLFPSQYYTVLSVQHLYCTKLKDEPWSVSSCTFYYYPSMGDHCNTYAYLDVKNCHKVVIARQEEQPHVPRL